MYHVGSLLQHYVPLSKSDLSSITDYPCVSRILPISQGSRPGDTMLTDIVRMFHKSQGLLPMISVFARIERGQGADLGKGHFCALPIILRALLRVILHFEGTMGK